MKRQIYCGMLPFLIGATSLVGCSNEIPTKSSAVNKNELVQYKVTGPDGRMFLVKAPLGSSKEDAIEYVAYEEYGIIPMQHSAREIAPQFNGYPCVDDCSGHEAGYAWAEENGIDEPDDCGGRSESFIEGCRSYAEEEEGVISSRYRRHAQRVGNMTFYSDGSTAQRVGNTTLYSDGSTAQRVGDTTFYSDGTVCQTIGSNTFC